MGWKLAQSAINAGRDTANNFISAPGQIASGDILGGTANLLTYGTYGTLKDSYNKKGDQEYSDQMANANAIGGKGVTVGQQLYGQSFAETGKDVQDVMKEYKNRTTSGFAESQAAKGAQSRYRQLSQSLGRNAGVMQSAATMDQLKRQQLEQENQNKIAAMGDYRSLVGNIASNQGALAVGYENAGVAAQPQKREKFLGLF